MGVPRTKQSSTLRYSRLLSFISITVTLFMLGALGLVYVLEQGLSHEVRERVAFTIELPSQEQTETSKLTQELRSLPYVRDVELITPDSAARSLAEVLGEDPTKVLGYNPLQPMAKIYLRAEYTHPDSLHKITASNPLFKTSRPVDFPWATPLGQLPTNQYSHRSYHLLSAYAHTYALAHRCYSRFHRSAVHPESNARCSGWSSDCAGATCWGYLWGVPRFGL